MTATESPLRTALRWRPGAQFEAYSKITLKKGGDPIRPKSNAHQRKIDAVVEIAHELGIPCRIAGLKPRQKGSSTKSVHNGHVRLKAKKARGLVAGGAHFQTENMFDILRTYAENDDLDPGFCTVLDKVARYKNGSRMQRITLATKAPGRSGTYQFLLITEAAYLAKEGVANADVVLDGLLKCVPLEPDTIIIVETTANGASGYFYDMWQGGITLEEFKAGKQGYVKIFTAWFEFEDSRLDPARVGIFSEADYTAQEVAYIEDVGARLGVMLDMEQVAWMRYALKDECKGNWDQFRQDYPSDPETAFLTSGRCAFPADGITYQESLVPLRPRTFGYLNHNEVSDRVTFIPCHENQAKSVRWEQPRVGCRYIISVDTMTGADQTGGDDPDSHSILVHRAGYMDSSGQWIEPALVMRNILVPGYKPNSLVCWWNIDVVEVEVYRMARYYQAVIAPEMNMDRGLVELLKLRPDADIYVRRLFNKREQKETDAFGWMTDPKTRPMIIEKLITSIREAGEGAIGCGYEVRCPWAIQQLKNFGTKPNGRMEALVGHDDDVLSMAIGVTLLDAATPFHEEVREDWLSRDLRNTRQAAKRPGTFS
ncbi:MAG: hypothetical protein E6R03_02460 [Hyphomicrobiaceae bacterium]|nr:MAG: hypothetical protein E6R03_02460 [Hyphomicrobiaceae bacterium]